VRRRIDPLYVASAVLAVVTIFVLIATTVAPSTGASRSGSLSDSGPGGATALRRYLEAMGATTQVVQGDAFNATDANVLLIIGTSETITEQDAAAVRAFVRSGRTAILATDLGLFDGALMSLYGFGIRGIARPGVLQLATAAFTNPPATQMRVDRAVTLDVPPAADVLATDGVAPVMASVHDQAGIFVVIGSTWPFLGYGLGDADNARAILTLAKPALHGVVAFDEYHHGAHPSSDVLVLIEETWPGRALAFAAVLTLLYLALSGRRIGRPVPLVTRPARSSLEYVRGFAGLVRRSGRGEIARRRLRADLHRGLARELGLDPSTPFERVVAAIGAQDRGRAGEARAVDDALARPLREDHLLRTVAQIERLIGSPS